MKNKQYIQGAFIKQSKNESFIDVGIKKKEFLEAIESLQADEKGFINLTMAKQRTDPNKYSIWLNEWKPTGGNKKTTKASVSDDGSDNDLPF